MKPASAEKNLAPGLPKGYILGSILKEKTESPVKKRINTILPIALSIVLPGMSIYSSSRLAEKDLFAFFVIWVFASMALYALWYLLWFLWEIRSAKKNWGFVAGLAVLIVALNLLMIFLLGDRVDIVGLHLVIRTILVSVVFLAIQFALKAQQNISRLQLEKEQVQTENYKVQLQALRTQVDPHFLFNSLNTLRSMVRQQHSSSEKFVMSLSDFYRQTLKHNENTTLPLEEELRVLESYLFVMKSRNEEAVSVEIQVDEAVQHFHLPTLALQGVVENCFKHNSMTSKRPLKISIQTNENGYVEVKNNVQPKIGGEDTSGYGLDNLRKRYALTEVSEGVKVEQTPDEFNVHLKLIAK